MSEESLKQAKKARSAARGWCTRAAKAIEVILSKDTVDLSELKEAIEDFDKRLSNLDGAQSAVEAELEEIDIDTDLDEASKFRSDVKVARSKGMKLIAEQTEQTNMVVNNPAPVRDNGIKSNTHVKLPRLELPRFSGKLTEWQTFWDKFVALVHNSDLPLISKFTYLQSLLDGEAKAVVNGLAITEVNYQVACDLLVNRYGRKERIIFAHIQGLLNLVMPVQSKVSRVTLLWRLLDEVLTHIRSLESLGIRGSEYGVFLTPVILSRLPQDIRMEWSRDGEGKESDLDWMLTFLRKEIERRERSETFKSVLTSKNEIGGTPAEERRRGVPPTVSALPAPNNGGCGICSKAHSTDRCWSLTRAKVMDRHAKIRDAGLCFRCLSPSHQARECGGKCTKCKGKHHVLLCKKQDGDGASTEEQKPMEGSNTEGAADISAAVVGISKTKMCTVLQTACVFVQGTQGITEATLMFDTGSDNSYITSSLVHKIKPEWVSSQRMSYAAFGGGTPSRSEMHNIYTMKLQGAHGGRVDLRAVEIKSICAPIYRPRVPNAVLQSFEGLELADHYDENREVTVDILIGLDRYWDFMREGIIKRPEGIVAQETVFGWVLSGSWQAKGNRTLSSVSHQLCCLSDIPDSTLRNFWELETIGIGSEEGSADIAREDPVLRKFNNTVEFKEGRYEVSLPWKENLKPDQLLNNEKLAQQRLKSLSRKLARDPELEHRYNETLSEMEESRIIQEVPPAEKNGDHIVYYMPHRPIVKESSTTTKVRPVFDASAAGYNGVSLNDCLETGPSLIPSLVDILVRFRRWKVALTADITKAFLQIKVCERDQNVHRFLWDVNGAVRTMKFLRVPFGNKSSPFLLNATIRHHLSKYPQTRAVTELLENLYVDDLLTGADTYEGVCELYQEARDILGEASMPLAKCVSNDQDVSKMLFQELGAKQHASESVKILGLKWLVDSDCFSFDGLEIPTDLIVTKRVMLSFLARMYDPLGFLTPFTMVAKLLIQEVWQLGLGWDIPVPDSIQDKFLSWVQGLSTLRTWRIPRCYSDSPWHEVGGIELHAFGDSSERGYGSAVYLRVPRKDGTFDVSLVISRARVAPLKKVTLPRLELLGALLCARLVDYVRRVLKMPTMAYKCWSDSTVALAWIKGDPSRWKPFVANRVREIQELTDPSLWAHCRGTDNPSDLVTRGYSAEGLVSSKLWLGGPDWLSSHYENDQDEVQVGEMPSEETMEIAEAVTLVNTQSESHDTFDVSRWGTLLKAFRVVGWCLRFITNLKTGASERRHGDLSYEEVSEAKFVLYRHIQKATYPREMEALQKGLSVPKESPLAKLDPFIGEGHLLRIKGRIQQSDLSYEDKHPIILPKGHLAKLLIKFQHELLKHAGVDTVISSLRGAYWILGLRQLMKTVKRECVACQRVDAQACNQVAAPLPAQRVQQAPPFSVLGLDYAGPLFTVDNPKGKFYILLFTCAVTRAVHLELTESLSLSDFMLAFRRFTSRRGMATIVYSDNARTFKGAEEKLRNYFGPHSPKWKYIVPRSPWWGGWWERLVRSVKSALKKTLGVRCLTRIELETTLHEVEACINSRPLTFVGDELNSATPLTPSQFLIGRNAGFRVEVPEIVEPVSQQALSDRESLRQERLDTFWTAWSKDYLRNLPPTVNKFKAKGKVQEGSLVLIREDNVPRMKWPMGLVKRVFPGRDGLVRSVEIQTSRGLLVRPIQRLHDLEIGCQDMNGSGGALYMPTVKEITSAIPPESNKCVTRAGRVVKPVERLDI